MADGKPPPVAARRRKEIADGYIASCSDPGGSTVNDQSGEVVAERQEVEGGVSAGEAGGTLDSAGSSPSTAADYVKVSEPSSLADPAGEGTPSRGGAGRQCSWGMHTAGRVERCLMRPQYEVPLTCLECEGEGLAPGASGCQDLGSWKDLCPLHAAAVSYVLMAANEDSFREWYREACRDPEDRDVLATVEAQGRLLDGFILEPDETSGLCHRTDSGQAALFCLSCMSMLRSEWRKEIRKFNTELSEARGELTSA